MLLPVINLHSLADLSYLSATRSNDFSEAAAVCLDFHHQPTGVVLTMEGAVFSQLERRNSANERFSK